VALAGAFWVLMGAGPAPAQAQKLPAVANAASASNQDIASIDAQRGALDRFLDTHPEIANEVAGSPEVMSNADFLHRHPELQAFLDSHALVKADPRAFISPREWRNNEPRRTEFDEILGDMVPLFAFLCCLLAVLWVLRTLLENRRWNRSFKMHEEVHTKLIEKFASGQDFNAYLQSEGGRRLLEWTPPVTDTPARGLPNPLGRIFWSLQAGMVLLLVGLGLLLLRGQMAASDVPPLLVSGTLGVTLGGGFILSALVSFGLSKHLGLINGAGAGSDLTLKQ
jgi:phage-related protein